MGLLSRLFGSNGRNGSGDRGDGPNRLNGTEGMLHDIRVASAIAVEHLGRAYHLDYSLESLKEIDRFIDDESKRGGLLTGKHGGSVIFTLSSYIGEVLIRQYGGEWAVDDSDPDNWTGMRVNMVTHVKPLGSTEALDGDPNGSMRLEHTVGMLPVQRILNRLDYGPEYAIYPWAASALG